MNSSYLRLIINAFDVVLLPAIEAGCSKKDLIAARIIRANLVDVLDNLQEWERSAGPDAVARADNVVRLAERAWPDGTPWAFRDHRTQAEVMATEGPSGGGDAA